MDKPELHLKLLIEKLIDSSYNFALYRLPWTDEPILAFQKSGDVAQLDSLQDLNDKEGFVFAPFNPSTKHPVLLIRGDFHLHGWNDIMQGLSDFFSNEHIDNFAAQTPSANHSDIEKKITSEETRKEIYTEAFNQFLEPLKEGSFEKLVLSRSATYKLDENFSPVEAFVTAANNYPRMMISLCHTTVGGTWIGSTPEIILSGQHPNWQTVALAGTMPLQEDNMEPKWSLKNQKEQQIVSEYIQKVLKSFKSKATLKGPYTARAGHLLHLKTDFHFKLKHTNHLGDLLHALHPTPAVCGLPKQETYQFILNHEGHDRSYYSGVIGWLDPTKTTYLYVNLRCMQISSNLATLFAGGGILPSSNVESEWEETQIKMNTMRKCLC